jgi:uroporphyrinogen decarboxylase
MRRRYGKGLLMRGGFDKHILARGPDAIRAEVRRLTPLVEEGGFIPHCDHRVPADVPMANYIFYVEEAKRVWGKGMGNVRPMGKLKGSAE